MEIKFKENHYKKSRFGTKSEKDLSDFKKQNITQDLNELKSIALENLKIQNQVLSSKQKQIQIPKENSLTQIITQKQLNSFTIILAFIEKYGSIDFLQLMTYTIDEKTLFTLIELIEQKKIKRLQILMTETASFRIPKIYKLLKENFIERKNCNLVFYWVHSKINLIQCGKEKYVIDGSGNYSQNAQVEHYNIFNSQKMFDFHFDMANNFFMGDKLRKNHEIYKNF